MSFEDTPEYRKGLVGERTVEQFLQSRGFFVVRLCNIRNHDGIGAPMMIGAQCNLILPDLQAVDTRGNRPPFYVEVKFKHLAPMSYVLQAHVHGIPRRNWQQYVQVGLAARTPVWLLVLEELTGELLALRMGTTSPDQVDESNTLNPGGSVFWRKKRFVLVAQLERRQYALEGIR
jgi:hypothetical protein